MRRIVFIVFLFLPSVLLAQFLDREAERSAAAQAQKLSQFYRLLAGHYVDTLDYGSVVEQGIRSMLSQLDPHSAYLTAEEVEDARESFDGSFGGIGVEFNILGDTIIVVSTIAGGPAESVGIRAGDRITGVDGRSAIGTKRVDVPKLLRGPKGSRVKLEVVRKGASGALDFEVVRGDIPISTVDAAYMAADGVGYIKVNRFGSNTVAEFTEAFERIGSPAALILDLRGNGGGLLDQAIGLSEFFLKKGEQIVSTEGNIVAPTVAYARMDGAFDGPLAILMDEASASGSEIVAGAVQDWDRGVIVGRPSFGKGLVQRQFVLLDGSAVRLTTARYHTPTGRVIQRPFEKGRKDEYYRAYAERFTVMHDSVAGDAPQYRTLVSSRPVYGGGGIYPDVYVERDTSRYTQYGAELVMSGSINDFVINYMDSARAGLAARYPDFESFEKDFGVDDAMLKGLADIAAAKGIEYDEDQMAVSAPDLRVQIKGLVAQKLWDVNEYYRVVNGSGADPVFDTAVECIGMMPEGRITGRTVDEMNARVQKCR